MIRSSEFVPVRPAWSYWATTVTGVAWASGPAGVVISQLKLAVCPGCTTGTTGRPCRVAVQPVGRVNDAPTFLAVGRSAGTATVAVATNCCPDCAASGTDSATCVPGAAGMAYL